MKEAIEREVGGLLRERGRTLAAAESCTGGMFAARVTAVSGSSDYFLGGVVAYANAAKERLLGVPAALIARHGAVSAPVARRMAAGARERFGADLAVGITGIAGPAGGTRAKPVGLVFIAVAAAAQCRAVRRRFAGGRDDVRAAACEAAFALVRGALRARRR